MCVSLRLYNAKLARMRGADLVTEPPCKHQDNCEREYVHELCSHEHLITYGDRMTEITSEKYQPDRQDGRKRAQGHDSNFEMKIVIRQRRQPSPLDDRENPVVLGGNHRADPPINTPFQWLTG